MSDARKGKGPQQSELHVLLVEDHAATAEVMQKLLERHGFVVRTAASHADAIAIASQWVPDLLICDHGLPSKDGSEVMRTLRQSHPTLRGIVVSGHVRAEDVERSRQAGFAEHLAKPISMDRLIAAIHRLLAPDIKIPSPLPFDKPRSSLQGVPRKAPR